MAISSLSATGKGGYLGSAQTGMPAFPSKTTSGTPVRYSPSRSSIGTGLAAPEVRSAADLLKQTLGQGRAPVVMGPSGGYVQANPYGAAPNVTDIPEIANAATIRDLAVQGAAEKARQDILSRLVASGNPFFAQQLLGNQLTKLAQERGFSPTALNEAVDLLRQNPAQMQAIRRAYGGEEEIAAAEQLRSGMTPAGAEAQQRLAVLRDIGPSGLGATAAQERATAQAARSAGGALAARGAFRSGEAPYVSRQLGIAQSGAESNLINDLVAGLANAIAARAATAQSAEQAYKNLLLETQRKVATTPSAYPEMQTLLGSTVTNTPVDLAARAAEARRVQLMRGLRMAMGGRA